MKINLPSSCSILLALSLAIMGCETTSEEQAYIDGNQTIDTQKDKPTVLAAQVPTVEEISETKKEPAPEKKPEPKEPEKKLEPKKPETEATEAAIAEAETNVVQDILTSTTSTSPVLNTPGEKGTKLKSLPPPVPVPVPTAAEKTSSAETKQTVSPSLAIEGQVVIVNTRKNFVIVDFKRGDVPPVRSELGVYRNEQFVGSIRITNPIKGTLAPADILTGTILRGDTVR